MREVSYHSRAGPGDRPSLPVGRFFGELAIIVPAPRSALKANRSMALHLVRALAERLQKMEDELTA